MEELSELRNLNTMCLRRGVLMRTEPIQAVEFWQDTGVAALTGDWMTRMGCRTGNRACSGHLETGGSAERRPRSPHPFGTAKWSPFHTPAGGLFSGETESLKPKSTGTVEEEHQRENRRIKWKPIYKWFYPASPQWHTVPRILAIDLHDPTYSSNPTPERLLLDSSLQKVNNP